MKKLVVATLVAASTLAAAPAFAQASGTIAVSGTVSERCSAGAPLSGSITLGELAQADGTIDSGFTGNSGGLNRDFTVRCNGLNPRISVEARPLVNAGVTNVPDGFTNTVHYTATLAATDSTGGIASVDDQSLNSDIAEVAVNGTLAATENNISLTISNGSTAGADSILAAGSYSGQINVNINPAV